MIDHLIRHDSEALALADPMLAAYRQGNAWDTSRCLAGVAVYAVTGSEEIEDPETGDVAVREIRDYLPGWRMIVSTPARDPDLVAPACTLVTDRDAALEGRPFVVASVLDLATLAALKLEPSPAGSGYPFGMPE